MDRAHVRLRRYGATSSPPAWCPHLAGWTAEAPAADIRQQRACVEGR